MVIDATDDFTGTTPLAGSGEATLLEALRQMQALQAQPILPDNPLVQLGSILSGFGAGVQGRPNPVVEMYRQRRQDQLAGLQQQATIGGTLGTIETQRASRAAQSRQQAETERRNEETERVARENLKVSQSNAQATIQRLGYEMTKEQMNSDVEEVRFHAYEAGKNLLNPATGLPMVTRDTDSKKMAYMGKLADFERKEAQLIAMIQQREDPFAPEFRQKYGDQFPVEYFPQARSWMDTMQRLGPDALEPMKPKSQRNVPTEGVLKAELVHLKSLGSQRSEEQERRYQALQSEIGRDPTKESDLFKTVSTLEAERKAKNLPPADRSILIGEAAEILRDKQSYYRDIRAVALKKGLKEGTPGFLAFVQEQEAGLIASRKLALVDNSRLPEASQRMIVALDQGEAAMKNLLTKFTPQERAKYSGLMNYYSGTIKQAIGAGGDPSRFLTMFQNAKEPDALKTLFKNDPQGRARFAQFQSYVAQAMAQAFSDGGKQLTQYEGGITFGWVITGKEWSPIQFEVKLNLAYEKVNSTRRSIVRAARPYSAIVKEMEEQAAQGPPAYTTPAGATRTITIMPDGTRKVIER